VKPTLTIIPACSIHPDRINIYNQIHWEPQRPGKQDDMKSIHKRLSRIEHIINSDRSANGNVSKIARRKMTKALDYLLFITNEKKVSNYYSGRSFKFKIAFITLTIPAAQKHSDNEIKSKCLNQLLIELKKYYKTHNYIWRAEKQKNGNLHFHLIVDKFIPHQELRDRWNRILNKLGYIDRYREEQQQWHKNGFRVRDYLTKTWPVEKQKQAYERGQRINWNSPNTTDIHSIQKIHNIKQYIAKYLTKTEIKSYALKLEKIAELRKNDSVEIKRPAAKKRKKLLSNRRRRQLTAKRMKQKGRIWGCNQELSNIKGAQADIDTRLQEEIEIIEKCKESKVYKGDYYKVIYFDIRLLNTFPNLKLYKLFTQYLIEKFDKHTQTEIAA